jgi:hypothetical protein
LDAWEPRYRPEVVDPNPPQPKEKGGREKKGPEIQVKTAETPATPEGFEVKPALRVKADKRRKLTIGISVSEEEMKLLRKAAAERNENFSAWARGLLFRAIGRKVPARPKKDY